MADETPPDRTALCAAQPPPGTGPVLLRQHDIAWQLACHHFNGLDTPECLWRPSTRGPHVAVLDDGSWRGEWPAHERYDLGPPSIAWLLWHMGVWWSMAIDHAFGDASLDPDTITCPGSAGAAVDWLSALRTTWVGNVSALDAAALADHDRTRWPFQDRPFADVAAWLNIELAKNAAELGYARFLFATRDDAR